MQPCPMFREHPYVYTHTNQSQYTKYIECICFTSQFVVFRPLEAGIIRSFIYTHQSIAVYQMHWMYLFHQSICCFSPVWGGYNPVFNRTWHFFLYIVYVLYTRATINSSCTGTTVLYAYLLPGTSVSSVKLLTRVPGVHKPCRTRSILFIFCFLHER